MKNEKKWCVYVHTHKHTGKKYIGVTSVEPKERWGSNGNGYKGQLFGQAIKKYGWNNFYHIILYTGLSKTAASEKERQLIRDYKTYDRKYGYNISLGGIDDFVRLNAKKVYQYTLDGKFVKEYESVSEAQRQVGAGVSSCINGYARTAFNYQWFDKYMGASVPEICNREEAIAISQYKPVYQYSMEGKFIREYTSIKEASEVTGIERTGIGNCMNKKHKSHKGFLWYAEYAGDTVPPVKRYYNQKKTVYQYTVDGKYVQKFNSRREITRKMGFVVNMNNSTNISNGYRWVYKYYGEELPEEYLMTPVDNRGFGGRNYG